MNSLVKYTIDYVLKNSTDGVGYCLTSRGSHSNDIILNRKDCESSLVLQNLIHFILIHNSFDSFHVWVTPSDNLFIWIFFYDFLYHKNFQYILKRCEDVILTFSCIFFQRYKIFPTSFEHFHIIHLLYWRFQIEIKIVISNVKVTHFIMLSHYKSYRVIQIFISDRTTSFSRPRLVLHIQTYKEKSSFLFFLELKAKMPITHYKCIYC